MYVSMYVLMYACMHLCMYVGNVCIYIYIHTCTHTHTHTHTHILASPDLIADSDRAFALMAYVLSEEHVIFVSAPCLDVLLYIYIY
jgi:hypothetical protein